MFSTERDSYPGSTVFKEDVANETYGGRTADSAFLFG
jgi:hypothetical protein